MTEFDPRRHPVRDDVAAEQYRGQVSDRRFVAGEKMKLAFGFVPLRRQPGGEQPIDTEVLFGETFTVYDAIEGWSWGQLETDGYVGWLPSETLIEPGLAPTHRVTALRTFRYPEAELKQPPLDLLSMGALVTVIDETQTRDLGYAILDDGTAVVAHHLEPIDDRVEDWVAVAEMFLGTPYLWGGRSSVGLDCSALIQLACQAGGIDAPRDSDMQEAELGTGCEIGEVLTSPQRGDLVFWSGHVGIVTDEETFLHANGFTMTTALEPLAEVIRRLESTGLSVTSLRRIP